MYLDQFALTQFRQLCSLWPIELGSKDHQRPKIYSAQYSYRCMHFGLGHAVTDQPSSRPWCAWTRMPFLSEWSWVVCGCYPITGASTSPTTYIYNPSNHLFTKCNKSNPTTTKINKLFKTKNMNFCHELLNTKKQIFARSF